MSVLQLPITTKIAALLMRRLPVRVRRVRFWRDRAYKYIGAGGWDEDEAVDSQWPTELQSTKGRISRMKMKLDLTDWLQRRTYFTGRFYQEDIEELLSAMLRDGDNFVDIGANIGLVSLHAAKIVGRSGSVYCFEPNPEVFSRLQEHVTINHLTCETFNIGLGNEPSTLILKQFSRHTGKATLLDRPGEPFRAVPVKILRGDDALSRLDIVKPTVFKIDVEGFEVAVLRGLGALLDGDVAVVIEVSPSWLLKAGSSAEQLFELMKEHGLRPYGFHLMEGRYGRKLIVSRLDRKTDDQQYDCLFARPGSVLARRLGI